MINIACRYLDFNTSGRLGRQAYEKVGDYRSMLSFVRHVTYMDGHRICELIFRAFNSGSLFHFYAVTHIYPSQSDLVMRINDSYLRHIPRRQILLLAITDFPDFPAMPRNDRKSTVLIVPEQFVFDLLIQLRFMGGCETSGCSQRDRIVSGCVGCCQQKIPLYH